MKLAQKPGEETVYKFNVNELRQLAKTAHQEDSPQIKPGSLRTGAGSMNREQGSVGQGDRVAKSICVATTWQLISKFFCTSSDNFHGGNDFLNFGKGNANGFPKF